jgi:hypothetical protein
MTSCETDRGGRSLVRGHQVLAAVWIILCTLSLPSVASAAITETSATTAALPAGSIECTQAIVARVPVGVTHCSVTTPAWTYYQAYVSKRTNDCTESTQYGTFRMQILARKGGTGIHIGGVWVVYVDGPRRWATLRFNAIDGNGNLHDGDWNYRGGFSRDIADLYSNGNDPIRYGANPAAFIGLPWGSNNRAYFDGHFRMGHNPYPYLSQGSCGMAPVDVVFHPQPFNPNA